MILKFIALGFFVKVITGFDDTLTNVPILASVTKLRICKVAFSIGTLVAICLAIIISMFFATLLHLFPYYKYIAAGLIFALAAAIHFDVFVHKPRTKAEKKLLKRKKISVERFTKLIGIGFIATFATALDDIIAYSPLFLGEILERAYAITGILAGTILEIILVIYFSEKITRIKYKEEIASIGLVILGILILIGII